MVVAPANVTFPVEEKFPVPVKAPVMLKFELAVSTPGVPPPLMVSVVMLKLMLVVNELLVSMSTGPN